VDLRETTLGLVALFCLHCSAEASNEKLRFVTLEFAPFIYGENKKVAGPGHDIIAAVCVRAKLSCTFDIYPWRRAQALMKSGDADGMMVIGRNPDREKWLRFSPRMFRTEYGFFVNADNPLRYQGISQIPGYRIGVFAPSNTARTLGKIRQSMIDSKLQPIEIDNRPDDAAGFRKLAVGRLDAVFSNRDRGKKIIRDERLEGKIRYAGQHRAIFYYAGITKSYPDQAVADRFFAAWNELYRNNEAQRIIRSYGLEPAELE
jgi:polar amino acid transport system substrate-binding protein